VGRPFTEKEKEQILLAFWRTINRTMFFGRLVREPRFRTKLVKSYLGRFRPGVERDTYLIDDHFFQQDARYPLHQLITTIAHECLHQEQYEQNMPLDHGPEFQRRRRELGIPR
jgi:hypothetical protein